MQRHAFADTVDSVSGTTANLHSTGAVVVICLTSLNHLCRVMQKYPLCLDQRMAPTVPRNQMGHFLPLPYSWEFFVSCVFHYSVCILPKPRYLTGKKDLMTAFTYMQSVLIGLGSDAVSRF